MGKVIQHHADFTREMIAGDGPTLDLSTEDMPSEHPCPPTHHSLLVENNTWVLTQDNSLEINRKLTLFT